MSRSVTKLQVEDGQPGISDVLEWLGQPFAYYPRLAQLVGGVQAAVFLANLMRWTQKATGRAGIRDGVIYKTAEELEEETGLTYAEQRKARATLSALGLLEEQYDRIRHRMYFELNKQILNDLWKNPPMRPKRAKTGGRHGAVRESLTPQLENTNGPVRESLTRLAVLTAVPTAVQNLEAPRTAEKPLFGAAHVASQCPSTPTSPLQSTAVASEPPEAGPSTPPPLAIPVTGRRRQARPNPLVTGFNRFWRACPKRMSTGKAIVEAFEEWKTLAPSPAEASAMTLLLRRYLADALDDYDLHDQHGEPLVRPADLVRFSCEAYRRRVELAEVLAEAVPELNILV